MNRDDQSFFTLLRAGLWGRPADVALFSGATDWSAIFEHATRQTVLGLVGEGAATLPAALQPSIQLLTKMRGRLSSGIRTHALINRALADAVALFERNGIRPVLFKGQGLAMNYIEPTRRQCGDIDLYIGKRDYKRACELVRKHYGADEQAIESEKHYHFRHKEVIIELHRIAEQLPLSWQDRRFQSWTAEHLNGDRLRPVEIAGATVYLPPIDFDALYIFNHAWHHFSGGGGIGLRQLCDWARFLHTFRDRIDHEALRCNLKAFGLWSAWRISGCIVVDVLGLPAEEFPFYTEKYARQGKKMLNIMLQEGNFGFFDASRTKRPEGYIAGKMHTFAWMNRRFGRLFSMHFSLTLAVWSNYIYRGIRQVIVDKLTNGKII